MNAARFRPPGQRKVKDTVPAFGRLAYFDEVLARFSEVRASGHPFLSRAPAKGSRILSQEPNRFPFFSSSFDILQQAICASLRE
jgi:hypothetical protein